MIIYWYETRKCFSFGKIYEVKKMKKKENKKLEKKEKKSKKERKPSYLKEVKMEMKNVSFPSAKEVLKYTFATIFIVLFLVFLFLGLTALLSMIKGAM